MIEVQQQDLSIKLKSSMQQHAPQHRVCEKMRPGENWQSGYTGGFVAVRSSAPHSWVMKEKHIPHVNILAQQQSSVPSRAPGQSDSVDVFSS